MGFFIKKSFSSDDSHEIEEEIAKQLVMKLLSMNNPYQAQLPQEVFVKNHDDAKSACAHIGDYIYNLMFEQNFSAVNLTITKDSDNQLIFNLNKTK